MKKRLVLLGIVAIALSVAFPLSHALTLLFTQTATSTSDAAVSPNCTSLTLSNPITTPGTSGVELMTCNANPAINANTNTAVIPTFSLGNYSSVRYILDGPNTLSNCQNGAGTPLTSGTPVSFTPGQYDYCAIYGNAPTGGLHSFTISWSQ